MVKILGIDPASKTGWTLLVDGVYVSGGTYQRRAKRKGEHPGDRWADYLCWVNELVYTVRPDEVAVEDVVRHAGSSAAHCYGFFRAAVEIAARKAECPVVPLSVSEWKKVATGKGNADKELVCLAMTERFPGVLWVTDDHSDAAGIAWARHVATSRVEEEG